jgi:hypothetical protein
MISVLSNQFTVTYDPVRQVLSVSRNERAAQPQELLTFTLQTLRDLGWPGASRWVGEALLLLVPETRAVFLPETKDDEVPSAFLDKAIADLAHRLGDTQQADDTYTLSMLYLVRARLMKSQTDLKQADRLLRRAAAAGCAVAARALQESWSTAMAKVEREAAASQSPGA